MMKIPKTFINLALFALICLFAVECIESMRQKSATSDEIPHLAAGYAYLTRGDYRLNYEHPPLVKMLAALPLLGMNLEFNDGDASWQKADEWVFGDIFVNSNRVDATKIVFLGRLPIVALGIFLCLLVYKWSSHLYGKPAGLVSLLLCSLSPNILAHARLVTFDLANALFTTLTFYAAYLVLMRVSRGRIILLGLALGLAISTKATGLALIPLLVILTALAHLRGLTKVPPKQAARIGLIAIAIGFGILIATYRISQIGSYFRGLHYFISDIGKGGRPAYLFGRFSTTGWPYYFVAAMAMKTPIATLILLAMSLWLTLRKRLGLAQYFTLIPIAAFLGFSALSHLQLGLRYILQIYPLMFILIGKIFAGDFLKRKVPKILVGALLAWYVFASVSTYPHYLAYFNEIVGGPSNGYKYLLDSNLDWGQDLPGLKHYLEKTGNPEVVLCYFGTASPNTYDIEYQDCYSLNLQASRHKHINSLHPKREVLAISANMLQGLLLPQRDLFAWLKKHKPLAKIGYSIFVYDITNDLESHFALATIYLRGGNLAKAERHLERILTLQPENSQASKLLTIIEDKIKTRQ